MHRFLRLAAAILSAVEVVPKRPKPKTPQQPRSKRGQQQLAQTRL